tara:strand:+ start:15934 stop:16254 length:321 start_codon:yes stop_codon:yes gene_type:complete
MLDCVSNLDVCKASCCKQVTFVVQGDEDMENYWVLHGFTVVKKDDKNYYITVPSKCEVLGEDNKCTLFGKPERPEVCGGLDFGNTDGYIITKGCFCLEYGLIDEII